MLFCAACPLKNCAKKCGEGDRYPLSCPTEREETGKILELYIEPETLLLAQASAVSSMDHSESRAEQLVRFAKNCGFKKIGIAFCISLSEYGRKAAEFLKSEGFEVESVVCKVGHHDRKCIDIIDERGIPMCNPVAQAEYLNAAGTELNVAIGLCIGHDAMFFKYSKAPAVVLIAKDHRYNNDPARFFDEGMKKSETAQN